MSSPKILRGNRARDVPSSSDQSQANDTHVHCSRRGSSRGGVRVWVLVGACGGELCVRYHHACCSLHAFLTGQLAGHRQPTTLTLGEQLIQFQKLLICFLYIRYRNLKGQFVTLSTLLQTKPFRIPRPKMSSQPLLQTSQGAYSLPSVPSPPFPINPIQLTLNRQNNVPQSILARILLTLSPRVGKRIALPTRVEPKVFFANERTFLSWLNFAVIIGALSVGMLNFGDFPAFISAGFFTLVAVSTMIYALVTYHWRAKSIRRRGQTGFDDRWGPTLLATMLLLAVVINFALRIFYSGKEGKH